jgi:ribosomal protein S18 acetylase RimI-like enzyme
MSDKAPTIRVASANDLPKIKEIIDVSFPRFFRFFALHSLHEDGQVLVVEAQGAVAGFAKLIDFKIGGVKYGCILWLAVHPDYRRRGIAASLVKAGTQNLKQGCAGAVFASVNRRNAASLATFGKEGFARIGVWGLRRLFGLRIFEFYQDIWFAPMEVVLMHD